MVATQRNKDSHSIFQEFSEEWDAPFTGRHTSSYPQSPQQSASQQSRHGYTSPYHSISYQGPHESSVLHTSMSKIRGNTHARKNRSKAWQLHKLKNERTLLQTNELLQQMMHLEKSLQSKPKMESPEANQAREDIQRLESKASSSGQAVRKEPCHTRLGDSAVIPRPKKDLVIRKLEEMEQQFLVDEVPKTYGKSESSHCADRVALQQWKQSVKERAKRNSGAASHPPRTSPLKCMTAATCNVQQSVPSPAVSREELKSPHKNASDDKARRTSLGSYTLPSPRRNSTSLPSSPAQSTHGIKRRLPNEGNNQARRASLGSYTQPTETPTGISPSLRNKLLQLSPRLRVPSPRNAAIPPRPLVLSNTFKMNRRSHTGKQEEREEEDSKRPLEQDENRDKAADSQSHPSLRSKLVQLSPRLRVPSPRNAAVSPRPLIISNTTTLNRPVTAKQEEGDTKLPRKQKENRDQEEAVDSGPQVKNQCTTPSPQKVQEKMEQKVAPQASSFRRTLVPLQQQQKFSEQGLKTIQEARKKRLQLLQQRQQDAQMAYLAEQRKRIARLSSSPAKGTRTTDTTTTDTSSLDS